MEANSMISDNWAKDKPHSQLLSDEGDRRNEQSPFNLSRFIFSAAIRNE